MRAALLVTIGLSAGCSTLISPPPQPLAAHLPGDGGTGATGYVGTGFGDVLTVDGGVSIQTPWVVGFDVAGSYAGHPGRLGDPWSPGSWVTTTAGVYAALPLGDDRRNHLTLRAGPLLSVGDRFGAADLTGFAAGVDGRIQHTVRFPKGSLHTRFLGAWSRYVDPPIPLAFTRCGSSDPRSCSTTTQLVFDDGGAWYLGIGGDIDVGDGAALVVGGLFGVTAGFAPSQRVITTSGMVTLGVRIGRTGGPARASGLREGPAVATAP